MHFTRYAATVWYVSILATTLACAAHRPSAEEPRAGGAREVRNRSRNLLGIEELRQARGANAFEIVQQLRPDFLRRRGPLHGPKVFLEQVQLGDEDQLRSIPASSVWEIRYLDSRAATQQFGGGYTGGVILVLTARTP